MNSQQKLTKQYLLTTAMGKRIIAKSFLSIPAVREKLSSGILVIVAGTTNGYIAEEVLSSLGQLSDFNKDRFFRGIVLPHGFKMKKHEDPEKDQFPGDIVIENGTWLKGKTIFNIIDKLKRGDIIVKGANALDPVNKQAAVLIEHPEAGTIGAALRVVTGKRVQLYVPVGLEKRIYGNMHKIVQKLDNLNSSGPRLMPVNGTVITEIEALHILTGAEAELAAAGGVSGAEGGIWLAVTGTEDQTGKVEELVASVSEEPGFNI